VDVAEELVTEEVRESLTLAAEPGALAASGGLGYLPLRVAQYGFLFISALIVTRELGPSGRAQYALPLALASAVWVVTNLTLEIAASRMLARGEAPVARLVRALSLCLLLLSLVGVGAALLLGLALRSTILANASVGMVLLATATIPFLLATQLAGQILIVRGRLRSQGTATALGGATQLCLVVVLLSTGDITPTSALAAALIGFAATGLLMIAMLGRDVGAGALVPSTDTAVLRPLVRTGALLHPGSVALQLDPRLSLLLVGAFLSARQAGLFSLSMSLMGSVLLGAQALSISAVHQQYGYPEKDASRFTMDFTRQTFLVSFAAFVLMAALAYPIIVLLYGSAFAGSVIPFVILLTVCVAISIENPCRVLLVRIASPLLTSAVVCSVLVANLLLTIVLIQVFGIVGAAIAAMLSYWALAMAMLRVVTKRTGHSMGTVLAPPRANDEVVRLLRSSWVRLRPSSNP
jgi:O-antigen/teichoic acid export membrane protein